MPVHLTEFLLVVGVVDGDILFRAITIDPSDIRSWVLGTPSFVPDPHFGFSEPNYSHSIDDNPAEPLKIIIPAMPTSTRAQSRLSNRGGAGSAPSGSEYHESEKSMDIHSDHVDPLDKPELEYTQTRKGRKIVKRQYTEADTSEDDGLGNLKKRNYRGDTSAEQLFNDDVEATNVSRAHPVDEDDADDDDEQAPRRGIRRRRTEAETLGGFIVHDDDDPNTRHTRLRSKQEAEKKARQNGVKISKRRMTRNSARAGGHEDENYVDHPSSLGSADGDGSLEDAPHTSSDFDVEPEPEPEPEPEDDGKPYSLRQRQPINYAIPPPLEELPKPPQRQPTGRSNKGGLHGAHKKRGPGWSASGAELSRWIRMPGDDSVRFIYACFSVILIRNAGFRLRYKNASKVFWGKPCAPWKWYGCWWIFARRLGRGWNTL